MCGLFGATSNYLTPSEIENIINLGIISSVRGKDSTGIAMVTSSKKKGQDYRLHMTKKVQSSPALLSDPSMIKYLHDKDKGEKFCIIGHTRMATLGKVTEHNAHPHMQDHIIGTHNGTIDGYVDRVKDFYETKENGVTVQKEFWRQTDPDASDSRVLFQKIATDGAINTLLDVEDKKGAAAIVYIDYKAGTVNLYRNFQRPLYIAYSQDSSTVYWASDDKIIDVIRNNSDKWTVGIPAMLKPHTLVSFEIGRGAKESFKERPLRETPLVEVPWERGYGVYASRADDEKFAGNFVRHQTKHAPTHTYQEHWTGFHPMVVFYETEAKRKLAVGCSCCCTISDTCDITWWASNNDYLCDDCYKSQLIQEYSVEAGIRFVESTIEWK